MKLELRNDIFFAEVERLIGEGNDVTIPVKGHSMRPMMRSERDKVILSPVADEQISEGAVMLFRHHSNHVMHRIRKIEGESITFAGDGNYRIIEKAQKSDIVAIVSAIVRPSGAKVELNSKCWRAYSALWLGLPAIVRRYILAITYRLKIWI